MKGSRISIALATTALVVAVLAATPISHAAGRLVLGKNSVGTAQLKKNAVNSSKVRNGSLLAADFRAGQLPAGPQGPKGDQGPIGPSDAFVSSSDQHVALPYRVWSTIKSITLPAGNYVVIGRAGLNSTQVESIRCSFNPSGTGVDTTPSTPPNSSEVDMVLNDTLTLSTQTTVDLRCVTFYGLAWANKPVITAIKVGSVSVR